jgi:hypothetical protein
MVRYATILLLTVLSAAGWAAPRVVLAETITNSE